VGDPRGSKGTISVQSWQYATLGVGHGDKRIARAYSIVSSPYEEGLEFFIGTQILARVHKT
jgi:ferredoxin-NADP reductase